MCVIIGLTKGQAFPYDKLKTATLNNPHGFGIVTVTDKKLNVYHKFDPNGNDPDIVARQLELRKDADMTWLHLRFATRGEKDKTNTHPFTSYNEKNGRVEFMHNGSLNKWSTPNDTVRSDSRMFNDNLLVPLLKKFDGNTEDIVLEGILEEYFGLSNRGLLISSHYDPMLLGKWETFDADGTKIVVSNSDYFNFTQAHRCTDHYKPKPAPMIQHQNTTPWAPHKVESKGDSSNVSYPFGTAVLETVKVTPVANTTPPSVPISLVKEETEKTTKSGAVEEKKPRYKLGREIIDLKDVDLTKTGRFLSPTDIKGLFDTNGGELDDELIGYIAMLSLTEFNSYVMNNSLAAAKLLEHMFIKCETLIGDNDRLEDDKLQAGHHIINLRRQLGEIK